ncbi:MAG: HAD family phosphatase [Desulfobacterales bacterium]|nr:HAD family phosphatase [Desulfobacterales bacterium]MCP4159280.1 HAD family phosphatase [Deltaproteobacteria bacterium]
MKIKNILWDNDGVLVDTEKYFYKANQDLCIRYGFDFSMEDFRALILEKAVGPWDRFIDSGFDENQILSLRESRDKIYSDYIEKDDITINGVQKVLKYLFKKYSMAIVTSSRRIHFEAIHKKTGFLKYFDFSLSIEDYPQCKPSKDPYVAALKKMGADISETIVIEDSKRGLTSAVAAGLKCIVIPTELTINQDFSEAFKVLSSIEDVPDFLEGL